MLFENELLLKIGLVFVLLLLSAFFAGIESSFFSMDWLKIKRLAKEGKKSAAIADWLRSRPKELVVTFLIGNELVNITASAITSGIVIQYLGKEYLFVAIVIMTVLILTFGEITPKTVGAYYPEKYALFAARPFYTFYIIITPFRFIFTKVAEYILKKAGLELPVESHKLSGDDLLSIITAGTEKKIFTEEEKEVIESALELHEVTVSEIMTPRRDIFAIEKGKTVREVLSIIKGHDYSRIPVYEGSLDNIIGILYIKDIIFLKFEGREEKIDRFLRKPYFVPEFTPLLDLMKKFEETKSHIAIVVDEHGTVVGLITFQDILEFIVGDIPEEYEVEEPFFQKIDENRWRVSGKLEVEILEEDLGIQLPEDYEFDTVAGFILDFLKRFPKEGESFEYHGYRFIIEKMESNRIISVIVEKLPENKKEVKEEK
ncbi:HlyC/CorC family transporter [Persephonella atlantica]|uniref:HlyC/CorC family transporter n=1 Tax=Persephonella atlantica TaxID=2699429 RepID=A0ABS1GGT8_9AQUI|nr:HlyC/CorC family transporter [Persephonella atlantica]